VGTHWGTVTSTAMGGQREPTRHICPELIAGIRLVRVTHVNHRVIPASNARNESVDRPLSCSHEIDNRVFRKCLNELRRDELVP
jgi:hypothetical protein